MTPIYFHDREDADATARFDEWRAAHPHGFYANGRRGREWMLHRATCSHEYKAGQARTAARPKLCDDDKNAILAWLEQRRFMLVTCGSCRPNDETRDAPTVVLPPELRGSPDAVLELLPEHDPALLTPIDALARTAYAASAPPGLTAHAIEGEMRVRLVRDRYREARLREAKLAQARARDPEARLRCEVPGCGFDFAAVYGALGDGYIEVHHLRPLAMRDEPEETTVDALAVVCANCHAMIHRDGGCRPLEDLFPSAMSRGSDS